MIVHRVYGLDSRVYLSARRGLVFKEDECVVGRVEEWLCKAGAWR